MAGKEMQLGALSRTVAANVKRLRTAKNWNQTELAGHVARVTGGWEIGGYVGVRRIESEQRRVSTDDLAALALAFGVSPLALMLPTEASPLFPNGDVYTAEQLWEWAAGKRALFGDQLDYLRASNPLDWPRIAVEHLSTEESDGDGRAVSDESR